MADAGELIAARRRAIEEVLDPLVPPGARCALLDFPTHGNVGDSAIWLGQRAYLRRRGARVAYTCEPSDYSRHQLARRLRGGIILLGGGGNLGDLWPHHQEFRERVIEDFPDTSIIQLPQAIHFDDAANLRRARRILGRHRHLHLIVRDHPSVERARRDLDLPAALSPDMSFVLGPLPRGGRPCREILWLARADKESTERPLPALTPRDERTDWVHERGSVTAWLRERRVYHMARHPRALGWLAGPGARLDDRLPRRRLARGRALLARGRVVITDRLHGHILSVLVGQPHVLLDNSYGKVRSFFETWTRGCALATWAETPAEALDLARALAQKLPAP